MDNHVFKLIVRLREPRPMPPSSVQLDAYFARHASHTNDKQEVTPYFPYSMYQKGKPDEPVEPRE